METIVHSNDRVQSESAELFHSHAVGPFRVSLIGLEVEREPTFDEWNRAGKLLARGSYAVKWLIGDWLALGERKYGETYGAAAEATGLDPKKLANLKWVASSIGFSRRRENLSWSHHEAVAALPPEVADEILDRADRDSLTRGDVRELVAARNRPQPNTSSPPTAPVATPVVKPVAAAPTIQAPIAVPSNSEVGVTFVAVEDDPGSQPDHFAEPDQSDHGSNDSDDEEAVIESAPPAPPPPVEPEPGPPTKYSSLKSETARVSNFFTRAAKGDEDLLRALSVCGLIEHAPAKYANGVHHEAKAKFLPLAGLAAIFTLLERPGVTPSDDEIKHVYAAASGGWVAPVHLRRRKQRAARQRENGGRS